MRAFRTRCYYFRVDLDTFASALLVVFMAKSPNYSLALEDEGLVITLGWRVASVDSDTNDNAPTRSITFILKIN